jgi:Fe-Mn family superoxide dismutase
MIMAFKLPDLPYADDALAPYVSAHTISYHYGKHHQAYVDNLNKLIDGTELVSKSLEDIMFATAQDASRKGIFNNAAQVWNHSFYWQSMKPGGGGKPTEALFEKITETFGSYDLFKEAFKAAALTQFGSGWAWLVVKDGVLEIVKTANADNPLMEGYTPLITCDVWEHAYYLDYQNRRPNYVDDFLGHLVNWDHALRCLEA